MSTPYLVSPTPKFPSASQRRPTASRQEAPRERGSCHWHLREQVTARLPDALGAELDAAAQQLNRCRADSIRQATEYYLDEIEDLRCGVAALKDPADPVLDWAEVRDALLAAGG